jgi:GntR family transcriptional regulator of vanillate catabolism
MRLQGLDSLRLLYQLENSRRALNEHRCVVDALESGETSRAECLISEHILTNRDVLVRALQDGERAGAPLVNVGELGQT